MHIKWLYDNILEIKLFLIKNDRTNDPRLHYIEIRLKNGNYGYISNYLYDHIEPYEILLKNLL